jgi:membrane peptidoglycan carboxypeptidase
LVFSRFDNQSAERKIEPCRSKAEGSGALVAIDPQTGEIKAFVGGYDFDESKFDRVTQALRQTGSSFKPFVYTAALDRGVIDIEGTIADTPYSWGTYSPGNYDGKYEGTISIRHALADSRNLPAVKILAMLGIDNLIPYVRTSASPQNWTLPSHRPGSADITLFEMTSAYRPSQRRRAHYTALHHQSGGLRRPCAGRGFSRREGRDQRSHGAHHDFHAARSGAARDRDCGVQHEVSAGGQDRHDQ